MYIGPGITIWLLLRSCPLYSRVWHHWLGTNAGRGTSSYSLLRYNFLFFLSPTADNRAASLSYILSTFQLLGVPVAMDKIEGPATVLTFLGILVDTSMC